MKYQLDKTSNLATVASDEKLADFKHRLSQEGLYFGYHPLEESDETLGYYLKNRVPNLYHFKFGSLGDLVASLSVQLKTGAHFKLKPAPRAAIGPDFNRIIIGSQDKLGEILDVDLKLVNVPERIVSGMISVRDKSVSQNFITSLIGIFIKPLFFRHFESEALPKFLNIKKSKNAEALVFCLCGLDEMVKTEEEVIQELCEKQNLELKWFDMTESQDLLNKHIFRKDSYEVIRKQYQDFVWTPADGSHQTHLEKRFLEVV